MLSDSVPQMVFAVPDTSKFDARSRELIAQASQLEVRDADSHGAALAALKALKEQERVYEDALKEPTAAAHRLHKWFTSFKARMCDPLVAAADVIKPKLRAYEDAERRRAEEAARRAQEEARKAEEARQLADALRAEEEAQARRAEAAAAEADAAKARAAGDKDAEEAAALAAAEAAEAADTKARESHAILEEKPLIPVVAAAPAIAKVQGVATRMTWKARVADFETLVRFVAANPQWLHLLKPDEAQLNALARSQKDRFATPGVEAFAEQDYGVRRSA